MFHIALHTSDLKLCAACLFVEFIVCVTVNTVCQYCVSILCVNTVCQYCVSILCVNTVCRYCVSILCVNTVCQYRVSIMCVNTVCQDCVRHCQYCVDVLSGKLVLYVESCLSCVQDDLDCSFLPLRVQRSILSSKPRPFLSRCLCWPAYLLIQL
jgi:hypothetical protein